MDLTTDALSIKIGTMSICHDLSVRFEAGQFWSILGINGAGKTTLLHALNGFIMPEKGQIYLQDQDIRQIARKEIAQKMGLLLQEYEFSFPCSVLEAALIGRHPHLKSWQWEDQYDQHIALQALVATGILELKDRQTHTLSGGEKRRLNVATLLTQDPDILLLDEPTNHLDLKAQMEILTLFKKMIQSQHKTGIMVIHDPNLALRYCDHVLLLLGQGQWLAGLTSDIINSTNLSKVYGCEILKISSDDATLYFPA
jgi:iron complex transport system ATP-binding protein